MVGSVPAGCGQCMPCRINRRRLWTHRMMLESYKHAENSFLTLTYDDEHLPARGSLDPSHTQKWLKRFRKAIAPRKVRFYLVGEYGDQSQRPHYHAALFGVGPDGIVVNNEYCSVPDIVSRTWGKGHVMLGSLTSASAQYICGYVTKKMTSKFDPRLNGRYPEFARMSRRPGIGSSWFEAYQSDIFPNGYVTSRDGIKMRVPRAYLKSLELTDPALYRKMKAQMLKFAKENVDTSFEHLEAREYVTGQRVSQLRRKLK